MTNDNTWIFKKLNFDDFSKQIAGNSQNHFYMGRKWRQYGTNNNYLSMPLLYSSLEFRLCIERLVFEIYYMLSRAKVIEGGLTINELKRIDNSFTSMINVILNHAGNKKRFYKYFIYCKHHIRILNSSFNLTPSIPDLSKFDKYWHDLSKYLHYNQKPEDTWMSKNWIINGYLKLKIVEDYIYSLMFDKNALATVQIDSLEDELKELLDSFMNDSIKEENLKGRMIIMKPILAKRRKPSGHNLLNF